MRKETVDLNIRSWLCSTQVGSSSSIVCEPLRDRDDQFNIRRYISVHFIHSFTLPTKLQHGKKDAVFVVSSLVDMSDNNSVFTVIGAD